MDESAPTKTKSERHVDGRDEARDIRSSIAILTDPRRSFRRVSDMAHAPRATGHLKLIGRREGQVWYIKTRVPGRMPQQTTRRLAPAHVGGGRPRAARLSSAFRSDTVAPLVARDLLDEQVAPVRLAS